MNILVINGSPRMERSNSLRMTRAFLEGLAKTCDTQVEELTVAKMHIEPCLGCLNCWKRTPGKCFRDDDMAAAIESYVTADLVVWSFPLYYYALPGQLKCFLDRTVPINRPVMCDRTDGKGNGKHVTRYDQSHQRHVLISTCGFFSPKGNYDAVLAQFDLMLGVGNYTTLFCGEGEMMPVPPLQERVDNTSAMSARPARTTAATARSCRRRASRSKSCCCRKRNLRRWATATTRTASARPASARCRHRPSSRPDPDRKQHTAAPREALPCAVLLFSRAHSTSVRRSLPPLSGSGGSSVISGSLPSIRRILNVIISRRRTSGSSRSRLSTS